MPPRDNRQTSQSVSGRQKTSARHRVETHQTTNNSFFQWPRDVVIFKPPLSGRVSLDFIPWIVGKYNPYADEGVEHYERTCHVHRNLGLDGKASAICTANEQKIQSPCAVCDYIKWANNDPSVDEKVVKGLLPKERQIFQVIDVNNREKGIQIWEVSYHLFGKLLDTRIKTAMQDPQESDYEFFSDIYEGMTLKITFDKATVGSGQPFPEAVAIDFSYREVQYGDDILDEVYCIEDLVVIPTYQQVQDLLGVEIPSRRTSPAAQGRPAAAAQGRPSAAMGRPVPILHQNAAGRPSAAQQAPPPAPIRRGGRPAAAPPQTYYDPDVPEYGDADEVPF